MKTKKPKESAREGHLRRKYGITLAQYESLLRSQGGGCAICGKTAKQEGRNLAVEHSHHDRRIRGICCSYCNYRLIGRHKDPSLLRRIADYLEQGTEWFVPKKKPKRKKRKPKRG